MAEYGVGAGGDFKTLGEAAKAAESGDVVRVLPGVYREALTLDTPGVTVIGEPGAVIDGGWGGKRLAKGWANQIAIAAPGVALRGVTVRNAPGRAFAVLASDVTLEGCVGDTTYQGAMLVGDSGGAQIGGVVIRRNVFRNMSLAWTVGDRGNTGRNVNGSFNIQNVRDSLIEDNLIEYGYGEGINIGRGSVGVVVRRNVVHSVAHVLVYVNRAEATQIIENILYHVPDSTYGGPSGDSMSAAIVIGDEGGPITTRFPASHDTVICGNLVVNAGVLLDVRNNKANYNTQLDNTVIEANTFVAGPSTRRGITISSNPHGRPHKNSVFRNNVVDFTHAPKGADIGSFGQASGVEFEGNAWGGSVKPPRAMQSSTDVYGELGLVEPDAPREMGINLAYYRPRPGSPLVADERLIGALGVAGQEPPVGPPDEPEPPVEPPDDPEPPVEPEPIDPVPALKEALTRGEEVLAELQAEREKALGSAESLARQIESVEMMLGQLDELIALLDDE